MGTHYFNLDYGNKTECKKDMPLMLLYIDNNLNGFAWQHMAPLNTTGTDWEIFTIQAKLYVHPKYCKHWLYTRRPVPSTDQALPCCFYFRIS